MKYVDSKIWEKYASKETLNRIKNYGTVSKLWSDCLLKFPDRIAITDGEEYSFSDVEKIVSSFRSVLFTAGIRKFDRVGILLDNGIDFVKAVLACATSGICALLIPPSLDMKTISDCCIKYSLKALITKKDVSVSVNCVISPDVNSTDKIPIDLSVTEKDPCVIMFTGGTTGRSKGALLTNENVTCGSMNGCLGLSEVFEQKYFLILPLTHVFGFIRNFMTCMQTGSNLWICHNPKDMFKEMLSYNPTVLIFVPALAEMALNISKQFGRNMLGNSVKYITLTSHNFNTRFLNS